MSLHEHNRCNRSYLFEQINEIKQKVYISANQKNSILDRLENLITHDQSPILKQVFEEFKNLNNNLDILYFNTLNNLISENLNYPGPDRFIMKKERILIRPPWYNDHLNAILTSPKELLDSEEKIYVVMSRWKFGSH